MIANHPAPIAAAAKHSASTRPSAAKRRWEASGTSTLYRTESGVRVLQRSGGQILACSNSAGKLVVLDTVLSGVTATGPPTDFELPNGAAPLDYRFPAQTSSGPVTALVVLNPVSGKVIRSALVPGAITGWSAGAVGQGSGSTIIAYTDGSTLTVVQSGGAHVIDTGAISDLAITPLSGENRERLQLYWTNAGEPKTWPASGSG